jgi:hypothetical protein
MGLARSYLGEYGPTWIHDRRVSKLVEMFGNVMFF